MKKLLVTLSLLFSLSAHAEFIAGDHLYNNLMSSDPQLKGQGQGYVMGIFDVLMDKTICPPAEVRSNAVINLVVRQLEVSKADNKNYAASSIVEYALEKAYRCARWTV
jgi:hypothetical protein